MARLRYNGLRATLGADLLTAGTTITFTSKLTHAAGDVPTISGSDYLPLYILDAENLPLEIVHLTAYTTGATTGTITRAQESTTATDHASGLTVEHGLSVADVDALTAAAASTKTINAQTGTTYTLALTDAGVDKFLTMNNGSASTLTIPPNSSVAFPVGSIVEGAQLGVGQVTIAPGAGVTVTGEPGLDVAAQYGVFGLLQIATDVWIAYGRLAA